MAQGAADNTVLSAPSILYFDEPARVPAPLPALSCGPARGKTKRANGAPGSERQSDTESGRVAARGTTASGGEAPRSLQGQGQVRPASGSGARHANRRGGRQRRRRLRPRREGNRQTRLPLLAPVGPAGLSSSLCGTVTTRMRCGGFSLSSPRTRHLPNDPPFFCGRL